MTAPDGPSRLAYRFLVACTLLTCALVVGPGSARGFPAQPPQPSRPPLPNAHRHPDVRPWTVEAEIPEFSIAETTLPKGAVREQVVMDRGRRYDAFTVSIDSAAGGFRLFVTERATGGTREILGLPFEWRPFSDLAWVDGHTLVFDRWSSPHVGVHYAVDVVRGTLIAAVPFHDD
jgi:hypothetical protein